MKACKNCEKPVSKVHRIKQGIEYFECRDCGEKYDLEGNKHENIPCCGDKHHEAHVFRGFRLNR